MFSFDRFLFHQNYFAFSLANRVITQSHYFVQTWIKGYNNRQVTLVSLGLASRQYFVSAVKHVAIWENVLTGYFDLYGFLLFVSSIYTYIAILYFPACKSLQGVNPWYTRQIHTLPHEFISKLFHGIFMLKISHA
jgi:hypothetical protein